MRRGVAVVGVGFSEIARRSARSVGDLTVDAARRAAEDAGVPVADIDGLSTYPDIPSYGSPSVDGRDVVTVHYLARRLGLVDTLSWNAQSDAAVPGSFIEAANAVAAGACRYALVFRAMRNPVGAYNAFTGDQAARGAQFALPFGVFRGYQHYGQAYRRYMHEYGATREHMASLILGNRANARLTEHAYFATAPELTLEDYLGARMLADPVCLLDCDIPVDGAVAILLTGADRAADARHSPAYLAGYGQSAGRGASDGALAVGLSLRQIGQEGRRVCDAMRAATGLKPSDVDVAQIYDGYSFFVYWWLEALGVCEPGEAHEFIQHGRIARGGDFPVNTAGGVLGEGRLHGISHIAEAALQAAGRAGPRQVAGAEVSAALVGSVTHLSAAFAFTREMS